MNSKPNFSYLASKEPQKSVAQRRKERMEEINAEYKAWKKSFYRAYESGDIKEAEKIYLDKGVFNEQIPTIGAAYKAQKKQDARVDIIMVVLIAMVSALLLPVLL